MRDYIEMDQGMAEILSALPDQFTSPGTAAAALAAAFVVHCRLWGITDDQASAVIAAALDDYQTIKH